MKRAPAAPARPFAAGRAFSTMQHPLDTCVTLPELLQRWADHQPNAQAVVFLDDQGHEKETWRYGQLAQAVTSRAARLAHRFPRHERLVLALPTGSDFLLSFLGALTAGLIPVPAPMPPTTQAGSQGMRRLHAALRAGQANTLVAPTALCHELRANRSLAGLAEVFTPEELDQGPSGDLPRWLESDIAFLQCSSGSTGDPKAILNRHRAILANERMLRASLGHDESSVLVSWLPLFHDMGLIAFLLQALAVGARFVALSPLTFLKRPKRWLEAISRYRGTTSGAPSTSYAFCVDRLQTMDLGDLDLRSLRCLMVSAEPVRVATMRRFVDTFARCGLDPRALWSGYGLAEGTVMVTGQSPGEGLRAKTFDGQALKNGQARAGQEGPTLVSAGRPGHELELRIVDPERSVCLEEGEVGEIWVRGPSVAGGYWQGPTTDPDSAIARLEAATFGAVLANGEGPFLRTGDLGFLLERELYVAGRIKDLIIVEGTNIYPQDLELSIESSHALFRAGHCVVFGLDDGQSERVIAIAELEREAQRGDEPFDPTPLLSAARRAIATDHDVRLDQLILVKAGTVPRTSSGKLRRGACRDLYRQGGFDDVRLG